MNEMTTIQGASVWEPGFSVEAFQRLCETGVFDDDPGKIELVEGKIERMPPPFVEHGRYQARVLILIAQAYEGTDYRMGVEIGIRTGPKSVRGADVMATPKSARPDGWLDDGVGVPLAVEIMRTHDTRDLVDKVAEYAAAGVQNYWVVDLEARLTHVFGLEGSAYVAGDPVPFGRELTVPGTDRTITIPEQLD